jgi:hypothetical protein
MTARKSTPKKSPRAAGYSGTPLVQKLGIREGSRVRPSNAPSHYLDLLGALPEGARLSGAFRKDVDVAHHFTTSARDLAAQLPRLMKMIRSNGAIWVSWPKKSARMDTDVTEDVIRDVALPLGLVDVKVCAVDEIWSGLKLVVRKEFRK